MVRDFFIKKFKRRFLIFLACTYWASLWCFTITMNTMRWGVNSTGYTLDQYGMGFATYTCFLTMVHINWITQMRDLNWAIIVCEGLLIGLFPVCIMVAGNFPGLSTFYKHIQEVISLPIFWMSLPPTITIMCVPYYFERIYWQLFKFP